MFTGWMPVLSHQWCRLGSEHPSGIWMMGHHRILSVTTFDICYFNLPFLGLNSASSDDKLPKFPTCVPPREFPSLAALADRRLTALILQPHKCLRSPFFFQGLTSITAFAIVNQSGSTHGTKSITLDAEIYLGAADWPTLLGSFSFFNGKNLSLTSPDPDRGLLCLMNASFVQTPDNAPSVSVSDYPFIGNIRWIFPLGPAPDPQDSSSFQVDPCQPAAVQLSGAAQNCDNALGQFTLDVDVWMPATRSKPTARFLCVFPNSPKYKSSGKPMPYNNRFISLSGYLTDVSAKADNKDAIHRFTITVEDIVFLGSSGSDSSGNSLSNSLDDATPRKNGKGFGFFKSASGNRRGTPNNSTSVPTPIVTSFATSTASPIPSAANKAVSSASLPLSSPASFASPFTPPCLASSPLTPIPVAPPSDDLGFRLIEPFSSVPIVPARRPLTPTPVEVDRQKRPRKHGTSTRASTSSAAVMTHDC